MENILKHLNLPQEAEKTLRETFKKVSDTTIFKDITQMIKEKHVFSEIEQKCMNDAEKIGINKYTFFMTVLVSNAYIIKERFLEKGVDEDVFWESIQDFKYKIIECKKVHNVWGIFSSGWYVSFFDARLFKLGRLEYEEKTLKDGKKSLNIHIPSSGPLNHDEVIESYKKAYNFFNKTHGNLTAFICSSYLLLPDYMKAVFKEGTNTYKFVDDFNILMVSYTEEFPNAWRIFNKGYLGDTSVLPKDTSMQRAFVEYLENGGKSGGATGAFMFDGERIYKEEAIVLKDVI